MLGKLLNFYTKYFAIWVVIFGAVAYCFPKPFEFLKPGMDWFFALTMFGIGVVLQIEDFKRISVQNRGGSIRENGVLRFDVLQSDTDPQHFILYEVYRDEQASLDHKETEHYKSWRAAAEPMMARKRESIACTPVAPTDPGEW